MRVTHIAIALVAALLWFSPASAQLSVSQAHLDSLNMPFTLSQLLSYLEKRLATVDRPAFLERRWGVIRDFYQFNAAKREIELLAEARSNLRSVYSLNIKRQQHADIDDIEFLRSRNDLIDRELALLRKTEECRLKLLSVLQLCGIEVQYGEKIQAAKNIDARGK